MSVVVLRSTGPQNNPQHFTPEFCERLQETDPVAFQTDVLGEFMDPESGLLPPLAVIRATRETPLELPPNPRGCTYTAAIDPAEGTAKGNAWSLVGVESSKREDGSRFHRVAVAREWRGLSPQSALAECAIVCLRYGLTHMWTDQYAFAANADLARQLGVTLMVDKTSAESKLELFMNLQTLIHTGVVELPPDRQFRRDLLSVKVRITQNSKTIVLPRTSDGRHCDYAPALALAMKHAAQPGSYWDGPPVKVSGPRTFDLRSPSSCRGKEPAYDPRHESAFGERARQARNGNGRNGPNFGGF